jgi:putative SOS response-associated peptidase YedK
MCGRLNISGSKLAQGVFDELCLKISIPANDDLRPTQPINVVTHDNHKLHEVSSTWGIKPSWSKKLLINAQAETVAVKRTFKSAFLANRCIVPCTGWYEWKDKGQSKKTKYLFTQSEDRSIYMAGILFITESNPQLVTLTTTPNNTCSKFHHRMPVLLESQHVYDYLTDSPDSVSPLLLPVRNAYVSITAV